MLDQIIGGSDSYTLDYDRAVALLGYTSAALLDDAVIAIAQRDGAALFGVVDSVVKSGHDPRRFVEDLLQRLRDLVIISLAGESAHDVFVSVPEDQYARMVGQAELLGAARGSRCADLTNEALSAMVGATAPRLQLELLCARLIVAQAPGVSQPAGATQVPGEDGGATSFNEGGQVAAPVAALSKWKKPSPQQAASAKTQAPSVSHQQPVATEPSAQRDPAQQQPAPQPSPDQRKAPTQPAVPDPSPQSSIPPVPPRKVTDLPRAAQAENQATSRGPVNSELEAIQKQWPTIIESPNLNALAKTQLHQAHGPIALNDGVLIIGFEMPSIAQRFNDRAASKFAQFLASELNIKVKVEGRPHDLKDDAARDAATEITAALDAVVNESSNENYIQEPYPEEELPEDPYVTPDPVNDTDGDVPDPAGVLGPLVDGTAVIVGEDNTHTVSQPQKAATKATPEPQDTPFYAFNMPSVPPLSLPQTGLPSSNTHPEPSWKSSQQPHDSIPASPPPAHQPESLPATPPPAHQPGSGASTPPGEKKTSAHPWEIHPPAVKQEETIDEWDEVSMDDPDINHSHLVGIQVLLDTFDAKIIEEIPDGKRDY